MRLPLDVVYGGVSERFYVVTDFAKETYRRMEDTCQSVRYHLPQWRE